MLASIGETDAISDLARVIRRHLIEFVNAVPRPGASSRRSGYSPSWFAGTLAGERPARASKEFVGDAGAGASSLGRAPGGAQGPCISLVLWMILRRLQNRNLAVVSGPGTATSWISPGALPACILWTPETPQPGNKADLSRGRSGYYNGPHD